MPAEVAKAILANPKNPSFATPGASLGGHLLLDLVPHLSRQGLGADAWYAALEDADTDSILFAIGGMRPETHESYRDSARLFVERRLNAEMIAKMHDLEKVTLRLEKTALFVGAVGVVLTAVSLWRMW